MDLQVLNLGLNILIGLNFKGIAGDGLSGCIWFNRGRVIINLGRLPQGYSLGEF